MIALKLLIDNKRECASVIYIMLYMVVGQIDNNGNSKCMIKTSLLNVCKKCQVTSNKLYTQFSNKEYMYDKHKVSSHPDQLAVAHGNQTLK